MMYRRLRAHRFLRQFAAGLTTRAGTRPSQSPPYNGVSYIRGGILSGTIDVYLILYGDWQSNYVDPNTNAVWNALTDKHAIKTYFQNLGSSAYFESLTLEVQRGTYVSGRSRGTGSATRLCA